MRRWKRKVTYLAEGGDDDEGDKRPKRMLTIFFHVSSHSKFEADVIPQKLANR